MSESGSVSISPTQGTVLIGVVNFIASFTSAIPLKFFGRKIILMIGHLFMTASLILIGIFQIENMNLEVLIMIFVFLISFQNSEGPTVWIYTSEVVCDTAMGICVLSLMLTTLFISLITEFLFSSAFQA